MQLFYDTLSVVLAISAGIMILSVFFWGLAKIASRLHDPKLLQVEGILNKGQRINIHFNRNQTMTDVRFTGIVTQKNTANGALPHHFIGMLIIEDSEQKRFLIKADTIRMIEQITDK